MDELKLPSDLADFLTAGKQLVYDPATCEAKQLTLLPRDQLRLRLFNAHTYGTPHEQNDPNRGKRGVYRVPGVDLIATCSGDYEPEGLLVWFPEERSYGVWDSSHDYILIFGPEVAWAQIAAAPAKFINAQWAFDDIERAEATFLIPWLKYPFGG